MELTDLEEAGFSVCDDPRLLTEAERQARTAGAHVLRADRRDPDPDRLRDAGFVELRLEGGTVPTGMLGDPGCGLVADKMPGLRQPVLRFEQLPAAGDAPYAPPAAGDLAGAARRLRPVCFVSDETDEAAVRPYRRWAQVRRVR
ncbi:hypothetical protein [Streptomyces viridosporus]|uniref:hypothetical protein n=1 Tax=Streptomyces viridosporus TaxID=67581 RepID=UPI0009BFF57F|nr:hypothetical protein [Streptomyces viridosporus]